MPNAFASLAWLSPLAKRASRIRCGKLTYPYSDIPSILVKHSLGLLERSRWYVEMVTARKHEYRYPVTPEWRSAVRAELDKRPRGALTRLAEAIGASTGQVTEMLGDDSKFSTYVAKVNKYFGWPMPTPPLASQDLNEILYLLNEIGPEGRDALRALKDMPQEERLLHIRLLVARGKQLQ